MADPSTTSRSTPGGNFLEDGHSTLIALSRDPDIKFWEKSVKPPGVDGGEPIELATMHNTVWRPMAPRSLMTLQEVSCVVAYDPDVYDQIVAQINQVGSITIHFSDGSTLDFWGYLKNFDPQNCEEGTQPTANITIQPTNYDPTNHVEAGPVMTEVAGT